MSSPPKTTDDDDGSKSEESDFTIEGLPLRFTSCGTSLGTNDVGDGGPARRIDCQPPQLSSTPLIRTSKRKSSEARRARTLIEASLRRSLIDDDDDEIVDHFDTNRSESVPLTRRICIAADDGVLLSSLWNVREHNVRTLPSFYPLEKSAVLVPHSSAPIVAAHITTVLQARSIAASYDAENAKVDCVSKFHVDFRIRLYRGRGEYSHGIIVEVQRRSGSDLSYIQDVYAILDAVEGKKVEDCGLEIAPIYCEENEVISNMDDEGEISIENSVASLQVISDILCSQGGNAGGLTVERRDFAMASLSSLTSLERMGQRAVHLSNELIKSEAHADLRNFVFTNLSQDPKQNPQRLIIYSLEILANVANCSRSPSRLVDLLSQNEYSIYHELIHNIENAPSNPREADLSCVILKNVCLSQAITNSMPRNFRERLFAALTNAVNFGGVCHAELQGHSQQCLDAM